MAITADDFTKYWKDSSAAFEPARKFNAWIADTVATMAHAQIEATTALVELNTKGVKSLYAAKDVEGVIAEQQKLAQEYGSTIAEQTEKAQQLISKAQSEFQKLSTDLIDAAVPATPSKKKSGRKAA